MDGSQVSVRDEVFKLFEDLVQHTERVDLPRQLDIGSRRLRLLRTACRQRDQAGNYPDQREQPCWFFEPWEIQLIVRQFSKACRTRPVPARFHASTNRS